jgi:hypothetical protein
VDTRGAGHHDEGEAVALCAMAHRLSPLSLHMQGETDFERHWRLKRGTVRRMARALWAEYETLSGGTA